MANQGKQNGRGTAWTLGWFAKPVSTGSIPASASKYPRKSRLYPIGRRIGRFLYEKGSPLQSNLFSGIYQEMYSLIMRRDRYKPPSYEHLEKLFHEKHNALINALTERSDMKDKLIAAQKKLSAMKRGKQNNE